MVRRCDRPVEYGPVRLQDLHYLIEALLPPDEAAKLAAARRAPDFVERLSRVLDCLVVRLEDYRGDFQKEWRAEEWRCNSTGNCRAVSDTTAPFADQAAAIASTQGSRWGYFVPADFIKFRELSLSYNVPPRLLSRLGRAEGPPGGAHGRRPEQLRGRRAHGAWGGPGGSLGRK